MQQELRQELEREYERFVEFGGLLDRRMRTYLVQYLQNKFEPERHLLPDLNDRYYDHLRGALDEIFLIDGLLDLTRYNDRIYHQVVLDTLYWLRQTYQQVRTKNPYFDEQQRLESWAITPLKAFVKRWPALPQYLAQYYRREELDHYFFRQKFGDLITSADLTQINAPQQQQIELLLHDLLAQWDARLHAKLLAFQLSKLTQEQERYVDFLEQKVKEYSRLRSLLNPFTEFFGWDLSRKLWEQTSFAVLNEYDRLLQDERSIKALADLLGSLREAEIELEEETLEKTIVRQEWVSDETLRSEIVGVHESNDLNNLVSTEAGLLGPDDTELLFLRKYADRKLLTFRYEDRQLIRSEDHVMEVNQRVNRKEKGPFIICIDTSQSMEGRPEQIAKVLVLGILKMAMQDNRRAYLINFSTGIQVLDLHHIADNINEIAQFLQLSFYGGTDATLALYEAIRQLKTHDYADADVLMVSDFIMHKLELDLLQQIRYHQQNKNTQFHCLTLGENANPELVHFFDTNWIYDPEHKGVIRTLTHGLHDIRDRY